MSQDLAIVDEADFVRADIDFLVPTPERPFSYGYDPTPDEPPASTAFEPHRVAIQDIRTAEALTLDDNGAVLLDVATDVRNFYDDDELRGRYYPEAAEIIRVALAARGVVVFDHNVRRGSKLPLRTDRYDQGRPVHHAHTDYTEVSAARRLQDELGPDAKHFSRGRFVQVNLWRPIRAPLRDAPLAICDGATVSRERLRPADLRYPDRRGEIYYLAYDPTQRWYYASDMGTNEAWLFKNFDSAPPGQGWVAPHSAFEDPRRNRIVAPRESIEVRAFAYFEA